MLFLDLLDEDNSNTLTKDEVNKMFLTSFLQDTESYSRIYYFI